jgi:translocation and assembly module TamB
VPDLRRLPRVPLSGSADIDASGKLVGNRVDARADVTLVSAKMDPLSLRRMKAHAVATGTLEAPKIDVNVEGNDLATGAFPVATFDARATIEPTEGAITVRDAFVRGKRPTHGTIAARASRVRVEGPNLRIEGAEVTGFGEPIRADFAKLGSRFEGRIDAPSIDLPVVARLFGRDDVKSGTLAVRAEGGAIPGRTGSANVHAALSDLTIRNVRGGTANLDVSLEGPALGLDLRADVGDAGKLALHADRLVVDGARPSRAHGKVAIQAQLDLAKASELVPPTILPLSETKGLVVVQGRIGRDNEDAPPEIQLHVHTLGLVLAGKGPEAAPIDGTTVVSTAPWRVEGADLGIDVRNDAPSGFTSASVRATDAHGSLVAVDVKSVLPYAELFADTKRTLLSAPTALHLVVPPRKLSELPRMLGVNGMDGAVEADLDIEGSALEPRIRLAAKGKGLSNAAMRGRADAEVALAYDGHEGDAALRVDANGNDALRIVSHVRAEASEIASGRFGGWTADTSARFASFPLEVIPFVAQKRIHGRVSGEVALAGLHRDASAKGSLRVEDLKLGRARFERADVAIESGAGAMRANVRLGEKDGFVEAGAVAGLRWGQAVVPSLDTSRPVEGHVRASRFRAAAIQPFVDGVIPHLDGRIEADARARIVPGRPGAELRGNIAFTEGRIEVPQLGEELRDVKATATMNPDGTIRVEGVYARGAQGEVTADAHAKLDGFRLADAQANVFIPDRRALAIAVEGQPIGQLSGTFKIRASQPTASTTKIAIDVPKMGVELPQVTKTGVVQLEEKENIRVGRYTGKQTFVALPLDREDTLPPPPPKEADPSRLDLAVHLGRVDITRGNTAKVSVAGDLNVSAGAETSVEGQIRAVSGWADVQGKKFEVEKGTVTFNGEVPPNPVIVATASWTAQDGSKIFADFIGPVKTGKVVLRSEPPRPRNEILAIILFGTADGANPSPASPGKGPRGETKAAVALGGGFATQGLTEALDDLAGIQATARIDTTRSNNPTPEVEFQLSTKVSVGFAHVLGTPPITEPDKNLASIEYRFHRNWSLETTVGDRGRALLDAIWQKRY